MKRQALLSIVLAMLGSLQLLGQVPGKPAAPLPAGGAAQLGMVELALGDQVELQTLVDYVSGRLGLNFLYDDALLNHKVTIRAPTQVPVESLLGLLQSALRTKDLAVIDAETAGWKRIVFAAKLPQVARPGIAAEVIDQQGAFGAASAITQVFVLKHADALQVDQIIKPFLSIPAANSMAVRGVLIVTDYAANLVRIGHLVELIDRPRPEVVVQFLRLTHVPAADVSKQISEVMAARPTTIDPNTGTPVNAGPAVAVAHDERTNQLVVIGLQKDMDRVKELVQALDVPYEVTTEVYGTQHVSAERLDKVIQELVQPSAAKRVFVSAVDSDANLLFVTTTPEFHRQIKMVQGRLDVPSAAAPMPMRFYKLQHVTALELLQTLRAIEGESTTGRLAPERDPSGVRSPGRSLRNRLSPGGADAERSPTMGVNRASYNRSQPGPNRPPGAPGAEVPLPPAYRPPSENRPASDRLLGTALPTGQSRQARVTADEASNTIVVIAAPPVQEIYAEMIRTLDQRRPQVLIEAKLVIIDSSDEFALGVEVSGGDRFPLNRLFAFTSYGLSTVNPVTGSLALIPGTGFNGALVNPEVADAVLRALSTHRRARILSTPRVLVNDNAEGVLASVAEVPFTSVNASNTVATTSFAGFAEAGTTIVVRPHIGAQDELQLEFVVTMSDFTSEVDEAGIPPSRQTEEVESQITIPDGHTVIVGGLNRKRNVKSSEGIPFIENIPLLKYLAGKELNSHNSMSLFVFIRPIILRDDKFKDLKYLSEHDVAGAGVPGNFPASQPLSIK